MEESLSQLALRVAGTWSLAIGDPRTQAGGPGRTTETEGAGDTEGRRSAEVRRQEWERSRGVTREARVAIHAVTAVDTEILKRVREGVRFPGSHAPAGFSSEPRPRPRPSRKPVRRWTATFIHSR